MACTSCAPPPRAALSIKRGNPRWVFTVTADKGDGSQCTGTKDFTKYPSFWVVCITKDQSGYTNVNFRVGSPVKATVPVPQTVDFGDIACMMAISQAATPVQVGALGPVPPNGLYYSCSTNITGGGQAPGPVGSVTWP